MTIKSILRPLTLGAALGLAGLTVGCPEEGPMEEAGENLDEAGDEMEESAEELTE